MHKTDLMKMTKAERLHFSFGIDAMSMIEHELLDMHWAAHSCPRDWHEIAKDTDRRDAKRTKVTINLDADVVRFFKGIGPGYQHRINRVLRAFMHMRLAKVVNGPDTSDIVLRPEAVLEKVRARRPEWGDYELWEEDRQRFIEAEKKAVEEKRKNWEVE
ncbi:BrnA antitoxin family protein [Puniceibacterium sediminis]|uniref:BrnA antitoxin of type II toxin-antitoxin system n=1 Tax=Puniceibacterium sediminis TaxID=1608407 RepID=A0A238VEZ7_9RHOB|nr:BrnA antitoxin family protein [Puniceibacterium sediminis]SNR32975.1 BrnA antitoxin of type II toxin-antitoxin system [Puniceibacterium sediminis]